MKENRLFFNDIKITESKSLRENPLISQISIRIAQAGTPANGFLFSKEVLEEAAKKMGLTPIVAMYNPYTDDFGEHNQQVVHDEYGEFVTIGDTKPIGVIPENPTYFWDEDNYLNAIGYIWTERYPEGVDHLIFEGRPQSMELSPAHTIMKPLESGLVEIEETLFLGLCILGEEVPPAFKGARAVVEFSDNSKKEMDRGVEDFMKELKFALNQGEVDLVVDTDGEERDKKNREKVSEAIETLDDIAEDLESEENIAKIDDAITTLVDAEVEMKKEANVIPVSEEAQKALQGTNDASEGVVSKEELSYATKKKNSLLQPEEEGGSTEEQEQEGDDTSEKKGTEDASLGAQEGEKISRVEEDGIPITGQSQDSLTESIKSARETASEKRAAAAINDVSDAEILSVLADRIAETEEMKTKLQEMLGLSIGNELPSEGEVPRIEGEVELEDLNIKEEKIEMPGSDVNGGEEAEEVIEVEEEAEEMEEITEETAEEEAEEAEETKEETAEEEVVEEKGSTEEEVVEEEAVEEKEEVEPAEKADDDKEEKKKKTQFSDSEIAKIIKENKELKKANEEFLEFKLGIEKVEKEAVLSNFDLTKEDIEEIRLSFSLLSTEEIEEKAIIAEYKNKKLARGQKGDVNKISFSSVEEGVLFTSGDDEIDILKEVLGTRK